MTIIQVLRQVHRHQNLIFASMDAGISAGTSTYPCSNGGDDNRFVYPK